MEATSTENNTMSQADKVLQTSRLILDIFFDYALRKFDNAESRWQGNADVFLAVIGRFVEAQTRVEACLPAFPFKSANKVYKVLGSLPDKAEELALDRLNTMCNRIQEVYAPGARVTIVSDGITYNDLLCITDQETWAYGQALRAMAVQNKFDNIGFARMRDLLQVPHLENMREITYVANCTNFRRLLLNKHGKEDLDIDKEIATNPDTKLTYLGYKRFLESDLKYIYPRGVERTANGYRRDCKYIAKQMLIRGYAFARAVKTAFPNHLRLSIHESMFSNKVSVSLLNTKTGFTTPWHCSVAQMASGEWVSAPMGELTKDDRLELVTVDGRPSYFKEKPQTAEEGISEATATYLQPARQLSTAAYLKRASSLSVSSASTSEATEVTDNTSVVGSEAERPSTSSALSIKSNASNESMTSSVSYGRRLIPQIMDSLAAAEPDRIVFSLTSVAGNELSFRRVSAQAFARAVDKTSWWLHQHVGKPESIQPVGYIGPHDIRHILLTYACVKVGYAALFLSPKNSTEGALVVLESTNCNIWVHASDVKPVPLIRDMLQQRQMNILELPVLDELLADTPVEPFPYTKTFDEAINDPFCYLHTSGTTGVPKPIPWSHGLIGTMDAVRLLPPVEGDCGLQPWTTDWKDGDTIYSAFPMSHGAGIIMDILMPALFNLHCVLGPVGVLPNINLVEKLADQANIDIWSMVPSLADEVGETPDVLEKLRRSKFICASGGPVSPISAGKANEVVRVLNLTGTTEGLFIGNLVPAREDWFWFSFHPYSGFEFKELEKDTYEHWVHRNEHWPLFQGIFHTFPDKKSINFKDLYVQHATKPNLWTFKGRSDDLVVLSSGYKISPLETEALVSTHPEISGCLVFGTGRPQAGLLVELVDPSKKTDESVLDSIWAKVQQANETSRHKNQLLRDFVTFATPDKPFFRTDKGTVKRAATLKLYADYLERFYSSRNDDVVGGTVSFLNTDGPTEAVQRGLRKILASSLPEAEKADADANLFELGLDSLGVFAAVKGIRGATGLGDRLAPRHVYANATVAQLTEAVRRLADEKRREEREGGGDQAAGQVPWLKNAIAQHQARQSFRLNALDYVNPNHGMGLVLYLPLKDGVSFEDAFANLQAGLNRTFDMIPVLGGRMMQSSEQEIGYVPGDLCVTMPPLSRLASVHNRLVYKDLSEVLPSFQELRAGGFTPSAVPDSVVLRDDPFPQMPANIFVGQANFVRGGCLLAVDLNHCCLDGFGALLAVRAWAENCRFVQGDLTATCAWLDPESFNHSLPDILHKQEGWERPLNEIDAGIWGYLPFFPPDEGPLSEKAMAHPSREEGGLPARPVYRLHNVWPLPHAERCLRTTMFQIPSNKLEQLRQDVLQNGQAEGAASLSISDMLQALMWRSSIRARYRVAGETVGADEDMSILELPCDGRPYFSSQLPASYTGSVLLMSRSTLPVATLCSNETSLARVAGVLHEGATRLTSRVVHDALTVLQALPDHSRFSTANMGVSGHMNAMISNMMLFPTDEIRFGDAFFGDGGVPETLRPQVDRGNGRFRFMVVFPLKRDGGVEFVLGTYEEELAMLQKDEDLMRYAELVD